MALTRRHLLSLATLSSLTPLASAPLFAASTAEEIYSQSISIDGCGGPGGRQSGSGKPLNALEISDVRESGVSAISMTIGSVGAMPPLEAFENIVMDVARWEGEISSNPDALATIRTTLDIVEAHQAQRCGLIYALQDGVSFEDDLSRLKALHHIGVRVIQPTYNRRNLLGDGCMEPADAGLSRTGSEAIVRMQEMGFLVDLSHCGRRTTADAIALASRPVAFTHTGAFALAEHPRHRTDAEMKAVADTGGVIGIYVMPYMAKGRQPTAADVIEHLEHVLKIVGEDHVSIGTDGSLSPTELTEEYKEEFRKHTRQRKELGIAAPYETEDGYLFANDLNTPRRLETLTEMLLARGHSEIRIEKILGGNLLRVFNEAW
ncbi:MAG TPA: membrane dipeptidase [Xanthomonadales bacterium]|nr:membrane dipeptidase [Xanthomonadales bacterium]